MRKFILPAIIALLAVGIAAVPVSGILEPITIEIPEEKIQEMVRAQLPRQVSKAGGTAIVRRMDFDLLGENRAKAHIVADIRGFGLEGEAESDTEVGIRYQGGDFFLRDLTLDKIHVDLTPESDTKLDDAKAVAKQAWGKFRDKHIDSDPLIAEKADRLMKGAVDKARSMALEAINNTLATTPVYSLKGKGYKMDLARAALVSIELTENSIVAVIDPGKAVWHVIRTILICVFAFAASLGFVVSLMRGR